MDTESYRIQWLKWHASYEVQAYRIFKKALEQSYSGLPIDSITYENYNIIIELNVMPDPIEQALTDVYNKIGLIHGRRVGFGINRELKKFKNDLFSRTFLENGVKYIRLFGGKKIKAINSTTVKKIAKVVENSLKDGLDVNRMRDELRGKINKPKFTKYQALRIARTETTSSANYAAWLAADNSGIMLEKLWISTKDKKTRRIPKDQFDHVNMDGVSVGHFEKFEVVSKLGITDQMDYPGDPVGSAGDVINCRCTVAYRPIRDLNGFVISR